MKRNRFLYFTLGVLLTILSLTSCSYNTRVLESAYMKLPENVEPFNQKLYIEKFKGGRKALSDAEKMWTVDRSIDPKMARISLLRSINTTGLFEISDIEDSDYRLTAIVITNEWQGSISVNSIFKVNYQLIDNRTDEIVWEEIIITRVSKSTGDAFVGARRIQLLFEATFKKNNQQVIEKLATLNLPKE